MDEISFGVNHEGILKQVRHLLNTEEDRLALLRKMKQDVVETQKKMQKMEEDMKSLNLELSEERKRANEMNSQISKLQSEVSREKAENQKQKNEINSLSDSLKSLKSTNKDLEQQIDAQRKELTTVKNENGHLEAKLNQTTVQLLKEREEFKLLHDGFEKKNAKKMVNFVYVFDYFQEDQKNEYEKQRKEDLKKFQERYNCAIAERDKCYKEYKKLESNMVEYKQSLNAKVSRMVVEKTHEIVKDIPKAARSVDNEQSKPFSDNHRHFQYYRDYMDDITDSSMLTTQSEEPIQKENLYSARQRPSSSMERRPTTATNQQHKNTKQKLSSRVSAGFTKQPVSGVQPRVVNTRTSKK